ncbi:LacI family DNA-binding transcriptional regulator [Actinopolymorpha sp. B17G11]|uniref:LacI family DNA-binding transcriptional regulator n=1 Tax=Actinopolymorpha sp. B17G11 TaxID=3160861 RepID=UPI0032E4446A
MTTLRDVAKRAGVSISVVSAVLNGSQYVRTSAAVRERVLRTVAEMNYVPNNAARSLRLSRSGLVAAIIPKLSNPIYEDMLRGIQDAAESSGYALILTEAQRVRPGSDLLRRLIGEGRADGFLVRSPRALEPFNTLPKRRLPVVQLDAGSTTRQGSVRLDNRNGAFVATTHLIELGHEQIAFIGGDKEHFAAKERRQGFRDALRIAGLTSRQRWIRPVGFSADDGYRATHEILTQPSRPTAAVVNNSTTALGVLSAAADLGIPVPDDLSVIGYHDIPSAAHIRPALTTVRMPFYELGHAGQTMLASLINGDDPRDIVVNDPPPQIIERGSTARRR